MRDPEGRGELVCGLGVEREVRGQQGDELGSGQGEGRELRGHHWRGELVSRLGQEREVRGQQ